MADGDYSTADPSLLGGGGGGGPSPDVAKRKGPRFSWNAQIEATFFQSLCDSVRLGLKDNHSFKQEAWERAVVALQQQHDAFPTKGHLINKSDNARKKFRLWRGLREDPQFSYNPHTRMVTGSEESWKRHIEKEPLSRSLKGRSFEHENYLEILFPDVVGSGGAPKRITKQRRKESGVLPNGDDSMLSIMEDANFITNTPQQPVVAPHLQHMPTAVQATEVLIPPLPQQQQQPQPIQQQRQQQQQRQKSGAVAPGQSNALTPPEENGGQHTRKRFMTGDAQQQQQQNGAYAPDKRRRTAANSYVDVGHVNPQAGGGLPRAAPTQNGTTITAGGGAGASAPIPGQQQQQVGAVPAQQQQIQQQIQQQQQQMPPGVGPGLALGSAAVGNNSALEDFFLQMAEAVKLARQPRWSEQALDILFRDFGNEELDLQLKIADKLLTDTNKATMFCKMRPDLRALWVKRLRDIFTRHAVPS